MGELWSKTWIPNEKLAKKHSKTVSLIVRWYRNLAAFRLEMFQLKQVEVMGEMFTSHISFFSGTIWNDLIGWSSLLSRLLKSEADSTNLRTARRPTASIIFGSAAIQRPSVAHSQFTGSFFFWLLCADPGCSLLGPPCSPNGSADCANSLNPKGVLHWKAFQDAGKFAYENELMKASPSERKSAIKMFTRFELAHRNRFERFFSFGLQAVLRSANRMLQFAAVGTPKDLHRLSSEVNKTVPSIRFHRIFKELSERTFPWISADLLPAARTHRGPFCSVFLSQINWISLREIAKSSEKWLMPCKYCSLPVERWAAVDRISRTNSGDSQRFDRSNWTACVRLISRCG